MAVWFTMAVVAALMLTVPAAPSSVVFDKLNSTARFIEPQILELLESLRKLMLEGSDTVTILDPLQLPFLYQDLSELGLWGSVALQNSTVVGLSTFEVEHISFNLFPSRQLDFSIIIPVIQANVDNYNLAAAVSGLQVSGQGSGEATVFGARLDGNLRIIIAGQGLAVQSAHAKLSVERTKINLEGLLGGGAASDLANGIVSNFIPRAMELYEEQISNYLSTLLFNIANGALADVNFNRSSSSDIDYVIEVSKRNFTI